MALDADYLIDRRRLKRRLSFWRGLGILAVLLAALAAFGRFSDFGSRDYVARHSVGGLIADDPRRHRTLAAIARDDDARALIVHINSPGGTLAGGEALYRSLRAVAGRKPVVAVLGGVATSAGYMAAIAADRLVARRSTITGSIGVVMHMTEISGLLETLGVGAETIRSGPLKAMPSGFEELSDDGRRVLQALIADGHAMFLELVAERRALDDAALTSVADGRVLTGRQALEAGLVDAIGGETEALSWLENEKGIARGLPVRDVGGGGGRLGRMLDRVAALGERTIFSERLTLDGLVSVWHAEIR
ncbi:MAG: signal peptide peptidase SppA [Defluviicoccus sp.]|nr:signal peptide peptidase SppA [Defluviicoccus sp.]MDE0382664.1 signal peptide peptidase SppA [Defluviicoccus sp.]